MANTGLARLADHARATRRIGACDDRCRPAFVSAEFPSLDRDEELNWPRSTDWARAGCLVGPSRFVTGEKVLCGEFLSFGEINRDHFADAFFLHGHTIQSIHMRHGDRVVCDHQESCSGALDNFFHQ